jgi:hypothetical protein
MRDSMSRNKRLFAEPDQADIRRKYAEQELRHAHDPEVVDALTDLVKAVRAVKKKPRKKK